MSHNLIFRTQQDYEIPLLRLLYELPNGGNEVSKIRQLFEHKYRHLIPKEHYELLSGGEERWANNVAWSRQHLKGRGFLDAPEHGIWRITEAGRRWVEENPHTERLPSHGSNSRHISSSRGTRTKLTLADLEGMRSKMSVEEFQHEWGGLYESLLAKSQQPSRPQPAAPTLPGITFEMLEQTKAAMPADQFRQVWGSVYDQLLAAERAKAITEVTTTELGQRARRKLDEIHAFLRGQHKAPPRSDVICDWIQLCYELELHREAASLWRFVHEDEVEPGYYRRAKKWAEASRARLG